MKGTTDTGEPRTLIEAAGDARADVQSLKLGVQAIHVSITHPWAEIPKSPSSVHPYQW